MSIDLRAPTESDLDRDRALAEYREALHKGEDVSVENVAEKIPIYELGKAKPVGSVTVTTQAPTPAPAPSPLTPLSGVIMVSGLMPILNRVPEPVIDQEQRKELLTSMGDKVLRHVNAHDTERLGELSEGIREKIAYLKKNASFTNDQWKCFAELNQQLDELIGDPYVAEPPLFD